MSAAAAAAVDKGRSPRERLLVAFAELVAEAEYATIVPTQVAGRAGLEPDAFEREFASLEDCLAAARSTTAEQAFAIGVQAFKWQPGWAEGIHAGLGQLLAFLAGAPQLTNLLASRSAPAAHEAERVLADVADWFADCLALAPRSIGELRGRVTAEATAGAVLEVIREHAVREGIETLPAALPTATIVALSPYVGAREAARVAGI